jgi:hypothetical protein
MVLIKIYFIHSNSPIIVGEDDRFDYTQGEPDERFLTILRILRVRI